MSKGNRKGKKIGEIIIKAIAGYIAFIIIREILQALGVWE